MKRRNLFYLLLAVITLNLHQKKCFGQASTYLLDISKSKLFWQGTKTVGSKHTGTILFKAGSLSTDAGGKFNTGNFIMDMNSISSNDHQQKKDNQEVDEQLKGESFFSVAGYPTSAINVIRIDATGTPDQYKVTGNLTIRNITRQITFNAVIKQAVNRVKATAEFTIDRIKFGIHEKPNPNIMWSLQNAILSDDIPIRLNLEFVKN
ncbi:YceI family protein [Mucilaginibacter mali]|uniref:YceI family protein n=1 Tax=Mucilaginibacter mali TaxID=2740462 RepID=A0A7D4QAS7_9SPHI|nr:YceI family protein [Mucilaginibacter mali]QKJ30164.1 YceI family protein [Mucilaginibacter mali]